MCFFFFSSRRRHTRFDCDWSSDVCSSDLEIFERAQVRPANRVASQAQGRIHLRTHAHHKRERKVEFAARRKDSFRQKTIAESLRRIEKSIRKGNSHVHGPHAFVPITEEAPDLGGGF